MRTALWLRRDLRLHDHPALAAASKGSSSLLVFYCLDPRLLGGRFGCPRRNAFLFGCLAALGQALAARGSFLVVRSGLPTAVVPRLLVEAGVERLHASEELTPFGRRRDAALANALGRHQIPFYLHPGHYVVSRPHQLGGPGGYRRFSPFFKAWLQADRRQPLAASRALPPPPPLAPGALPGATADLPLAPGEQAARRRMATYLRNHLHRYAQLRAEPGRDRTTHLSPYLHFGALSARELEARICRFDPDSELRRQLAWRDFFAALLYHHPTNLHAEHQPRYRRSRPYGRNPRFLRAWKEGKTGFPLVDAAMRQLLAEGQLPNRLRLLCASFLTKQLGVDWREGERHFMHHLLDGDVASNNGNWQWAASVGADPAPLLRRLYNPVRQQRRYDPHGAYVRRYLPQLKAVPDRYLPTPWLMDRALQEASGCRIGRDYPAPLLPLQEARAQALARYRR